MFLGEHELYQLTRRRKHSAQVRMLRFMGIEHRVRADGSIAVLKAHVDKTFGFSAEKPRSIARTEPNWGGVW